MVFTLLSLIGYTQVYDIEDYCVGIQSSPFTGNDFSGLAADVEGNILVTIREDEGIIVQEQDVSGTIDKLSFSC